MQVQREIVNNPLRGSSIIFIESCLVQYVTICNDQNVKKKKKNGTNNAKRIELPLVSRCTLVIFLETNFLGDF